MRVRPLGFQDIQWGGSTRDAVYKVWRHAAVRATPGQADEYGAERRTVSVDGARLHWRILLADGGQVTRTPVTMIHGATTNSADFMISIAAQPAKDRPVYAVDRPGSGFSDRGDPYTAHDPREQARRIAAGLRVLGVERTVVLGHSYGGAVALAFALVAPELTAGLVLLAPVSHPWPGGLAWYHEVAARPILGAVLTHTVVPVYGRVGGPRAIDGAFTPDRAPDAYWRRARMDLYFRPHAFRATAEDLVRLKAHISEMVPHYRRLRVPSEILVGTHDLTVSPSLHAYNLAQDLSDARLAFLRGVGHAPHHAQPEAVLAALARLA